VAQVATSALEDAGAAAHEIRFDSHVASILQAHCFTCHGGERTEAGLDLRTKAGLLRGGDSGPALVPGRPDESRFLTRIEQGEMPPEGQPAPGTEQVAILRAWVAAGAPGGGGEAGPEAAGRVTPADRAFWSFQPPRRPPVPSVNGIDRVRTPIDAFLLARLEPLGLTFNPDAPKPVLLRRLTFDLWGLPPTPEQLAEFLADERPDAYERLVDRLLAAPAYGERWGRHWLDVAGYADSDGYLAADRLRPEAWRYRDWIVRAVNADLPYDQFLLYQLAGDELFDWRRAPELTSDMADALVATGFLRCASDPTYPGYTEPNEIHQVISDTMQIMGTALLGLTLQCARCHAHKYDPISQRDYYALAALLLPALDPARWLPSETRGALLATESQQARVQEHNRLVDERVAVLQASLAELTAGYRRRLADELTAAVPPGTLSAEERAQLAAALAQPPDARNEEQKALVARLAPNANTSDVALEQRYPQFAEEARKLRTAIEAETALRKQLVLARALVDLEGEPPQAHVLVRGDYNRPGAAVEPGVPEVLAPPGFRLPIEPGYKTSGRRLALARWLTSPEHPLTARVHVNRVWAKHFGRGLVPTVANFGRSGSPPTHPELLDWLACAFISQGWSQKALHRLMVLSTAYRQSSAHDPAKAAVDPENELLWAWRPRRVEGEVVRDSLLSVSGKLNPQMYGPPAPVLPQADGSVITADDPASNRRSLYLIVRRSQHLTLLDLFDTPMMEINCPQRNESIVPLQALAMWHGPAAEQAAAALAERLVREAPDQPGRVRRAWHLLFARDPEPSEADHVLDFLENHARLAAGPRYSALDESEREALHTAAWRDAALVLLNTSEFLYVH
jgi:mono/diheme cytochrome c family protein